HGRSLWILDVTALRQMKSSVLAKKAHLYQPNTVVRWQQQAIRGKTNRRFVGENPTTGATFYYSLTQKANKGTAKVLDDRAKVVGQLPGATGAGLHTLTWPQTLGFGRKGGGGGGRPGGPGGGPGVFQLDQIRRPLTPGTYRVVLNVDGQEFTQR